MFYKVYYYNSFEKLHDYYIVLADDEKGAEKQFYYRVFTETDLAPEDVEITSIELDKDEEEV